MSALAVVCGVLGLALLASAAQPMERSFARVLERWADAWRQAGIEWWPDRPPATVALAMAALTISIVAALGLGAVGGIVAASVIIVAPPRVRRWQRQRRERRFDQQLPDALAALATGLRAGQSLPAAMAPLASRFPAPTGDVLRAAADRVRVGEPVGRALAEAGAAYHSQEWWLFAVTVDTLLRMGGNLAQMVETTAATIRRRQRIHERLQTLTAQGRMQAWVMGLLPPGMLLVLRAVEPPLYEQLVGSVVGWGLLAVAAALEALAVLLMRRILTVEV